ncbi:uncharacterized protein Dmoj_GI25506 [Drosophila mojavensis]|uniref:Uncharacterized protein n=1 Tax=Drosophila mojavensis TaxID=7230 RepID=A0A0Q9X6C3_DROMO|nr:uncharacterized protein Dmoj_GI25506 [Drosophila mojavensis]
MFSHLCNIVGCLFIGLVLCQSASVDWVRTKRDTRDIPSDKFKPLQPSSTNVKESLPPVNNDTNDRSTFQEVSIKGTRLYKLSSLNILVVYIN